ncbi:hypothetical protein VPH35_133593 [Triticum aestivum]
MARQGAGGEWCPGGRLQFSGCGKFGRWRAGASPARSDGLWRRQAARGGGGGPAGALRVVASSGMAATTRSTWSARGGSGTCSGTCSSAIDLGIVAAVSLLSPWFSRETPCIQWARWRHPDVVSFLKVLPWSPLFVMHCFSSSRRLILGSGPTTTS